MYIPWMSQGPPQGTYALLSGNQQLPPSRFNGPSSQATKGVTQSHSDLSPPLPPPSDSAPSCGFYCQGLPPNLQPLTAARAASPGSKLGGSFIHSINRYLLMSPDEGNRDSPPDPASGCSSHTDRTYWTLPFLVIWLTPPRPQGQVRCPFLQEAHLA